MTVLDIFFYRNKTMHQLIVHYFYSNKTDAFNDVVRNSNLHP